MKEQQKGQDDWIHLEITSQGEHPPAASHPMPLCWCEEEKVARVKAVGLGVVGKVWACNQNNKDVNLQA